jgi:hypothetical protein
MNLSQVRNLKSAYTIILILQSMHSANIRRGTSFVQVTFAIISIQFAYMWFSVVFMKSLITELGGPVFISYLFIDFFLILASILFTLTRGAEAN